MASGDVTVFTHALADIGNGKHDFSADVFKLGLVATNVSKDQTTPSWSDWSASEVSTAGGYTADGEIIANVVWSSVAPFLLTYRFDGDDVVLAEDPAGFTNAFFGIIYNATAAGDPALAFVDLDGPQSEASGGLAVRWNTRGVFSITN